MTIRKIKGRFLVNAKTSQYFAEKNPTLLLNELVIEKDTGKKKLGDGTNKYNDLTYLESTTWEEITNKPTTLENYGIVDAKINDGTITLGENSITPLTEHQSLTNYVTLDGTQTISGSKIFSNIVGFTAAQTLISDNNVITWYSGSPNSVRGTLSNSDYSGTAAYAKKLSTDAGDETTPVYFKNGVPVACTSGASNKALTIQVNGSDLDTYDGSIAKIIDITADKIGALSVNKDEDSTADFGLEVINNEVFLLSTTSDGAEMATFNANVPWDNIMNKPQIYEVIYPAYTTGLYKFCTNSFGQVTGAVEVTGDDISVLNPTAAKVTTSTDSANYTGYIPFVSETGVQELKTNASLTFNPYTGTLSATKVLNATYNDYAEFFPRGEQTEAGDIIALDLNSENEQYIKATKDSIVAGVHSDEYAHLIGGEITPNGEDFVSYNIKKYIPVSLAGRVHVKVKGKVKRGDYIIASDIPGVGITTENPINQRAIVGYAVESSNDEDIKLIRVRVKGA